MKAARRIALFIIAAIASAVIGAIALGTPDWIRAYRDHNRLEKLLAEMRILDHYVDQQSMQLGFAYESKWLLPTASPEELNLPDAERAAALPEHFTVEARIKGLWFSIFPACEEMIRTQGRIAQYDGNVDSGVLAEFAEDAEYIYYWSHCRKIKEPRYTYIGGTENEWRDYIVKEQETIELPDSVRDQIQSYRNRCTISRGQYMDKPCSEMFDRET